MAKDSILKQYSDPGSVLTLPRAKYLSGEVWLPGSKSIANRALYLAALSRGMTELINLPDSDDVQVLLGALPLLGAKVSRGEREGFSAGSGSQSPPSILIDGTGGPFPVPEARLNLQNAGTALRPMVALLAASKGHFVVDGNEQMRRRPIRDLVEAVARLGVEISCSPTGCPPVEIRAKGIRGGRTVVSGSVSSQYLTALLLAGPFAYEEDLIVEIEGDLVSKPYVDITLRMMEDFGVRVERDAYKRFRVPHGASYVSPKNYPIEGDSSAATYFLGAGALPGSGPVTVHGIFRNSYQGDTAFAGLLEGMGAKIARDERSITVYGVPEGAKLRALDVDMNHMPDAAMTLAVLALFADGETKIRNIANLRVKESERIRGLRTELEKLGAHVVELEDALFITPPERICPARIETYHDHRMAMAFSLASFATDLEIINPSCVTKTYPAFFDDFLPMRK